MSSGSTSSGPGARSVLAIDGVDGSGKSRFAEALAAGCAQAGAPAVVLHVDDFRRPLDWAGSDEANLYYERYYDLPLLDHCLRCFLEGRPAASVPRFDPEREALDGAQELRFGDAPLLIVEGIFVLRLSAVAGAPRAR